MSDDKKGVAPGELAPCAEVWSALVRYRRELIFYARALGVADEAQDVVHEAMIRTICASRLERSQLRAFLYAVVRNLAVDMHRRRSRTVGLGDLTVEVAGPEEDLCDQAEARWLWRRVTCLSEIELAAIRAKAAGEDYRTVAARLGLSEKAVECAVGRARTKLRRFSAADRGDVW